MKRLIGIDVTATRRLFKRFRGHIASQRQLLAGAALCMAGAVVVEILRPWPMKVIFDGAILGNHGKGMLAEFFSHTFGTGNPLVAACAVSILLLAIVGSILEFGQAVLLGTVGRRVTAGVRLELYKHIQCLPQSFHDNSSVGDLLTRLTGDVRMLRDLLVTSGIYMVGRAMVIAATLFVMLIMDWRLTIVAALLIPALMASVAIFTRRMRKSARRLRKTEGKAAHLLAENLESIRLIQSHGREEHEVARFQRENVSSADEELRSLRIEASMGRVVEVLLAIGLCLVLWFGVMRVRAGALSPGDLLVFTAYLSALRKPARKLATMSSRLAKATACGERVMAILDREPQIADRPGAVAIDRLQGVIEFDRVTFSYVHGNHVLRDASVRIEKGETVAFLSPSGSGKSTIGHLLLRFYEPEAGAVRIDGLDIRDLRLADLREQITVLLQDPVVFNTSVRDNIAYGRLDATDEEIIEAARAARAHDFIMRLPEGYHTVLGRKGLTLSGGQRQRIAMARAMVRKSPIIILDEPSTGLDADSEAAVMSEARVLAKDRTCIIITHDRLIAAGADRIFQIIDGQIRELAHAPFGSGILRAMPHGVRA